MHNRPVHNGKTAKSPIRMIHYGYDLDAGAMEAKYQRRLAMIGDWINKQPRDYAARAYMAQALMERPATREDCVIYALKALELARARNASSQQLCTIYYPLMAALHYLKRHDEAEAHCKDCLRMAPRYADPYFFLTNIYFIRQNWRGACECARVFAELQGSPQGPGGGLGLVENMTVNQLPTVLLQWLLAAWELGDRRQVQQVLGLLCPHPQGEAQLKRALEHLAAKGKTKEAGQLGRMIRQLRPEWSWSAAWGG